MGSTIGAGGTTTTGFAGTKGREGFGGAIEVFVIGRGSLGLLTITGGRFTIETRLTLLRTAVATGELVKLTLKARFKLFDATVEVPDTLGELFRERRGCLLLEDALLRLLTAVTAVGVTIPL